MAMPWLMIGDCQYQYMDKYNDIEAKGYQLAFRKLVAGEKLTWINKYMID
jgi:hypothetical protein